MTRFLELFDAQSAKTPDAVAFRNSDGETLTYAQLHAWSGALAAYLLEALPPKRPTVVYGHKSAWMVVCILACMRSGRAYVPADVSFPPARVKDILAQLGPTILLDTTPTGLSLPDAPEHTRLSRERIVEIACDPQGPQVSPDAYPSGYDDVYVIFTSGSTGRPKGVRFSSHGLDAFLDFVHKFMMPELLDDPACVSFDRVPYSFDISVTDLVGCLSVGATLYAITETAERDLRSTFEALRTSGANFLFATPSFINMCLTSPDFNEGLMPELHTVVLGGETLRCGMARKLFDRFPRLKLLNGYGPTETQWLTAARITPEMVREDCVLPIGTTNAGTEIHILDPETLEEKPFGEPGEIYIYGHTVGNGYYGRPDLTEKAFGEATLSDGTPTRRYKTGDNGYMTPDGTAYFYGRYDFQVKLHGYRIELGEVEARLSGLPEVVNASVIPFMRGGEMDYLCACVMLMPGVAATYATTRMLKDALREHLPAYMVPRKFVYLDALPLNSNGKVDRKALTALYGVAKSDREAAASAEAASGAPAVPVDAACRPAQEAPAPVEAASNPAGR